MPDGDRDRELAEIAALIADIREKGPSERSQESLSRLIDYRRGPQGRVVVVRRRAAKDLRSLRGDDIVPLSGIFDIKRPAKRNRYIALRDDKSYKGPRIVAEGDSWFEHPCTKDLIEWLGVTHAVLSLAKAGDTWADYVGQEGQQYSDGTPSGLFANITAEKPDIVIIGASGNEILGSIENYVRHYERDRPWDQYIIMDKFEEVLKVCEAWCEVFAKSVVREGPHVIFHTYDYPNPRRHEQYLGAPLEFSCGIWDESLMRTILNQMIDLYHDRIARKLNDLNLPKAHFLNLRGIIGSKDPYSPPDRSYWWDEIHPTFVGSELIAKKFRELIEKL